MSNGTSRTHRCAGGPSLFASARRVVVAIVATSAIASCGASKAKTALDALNYADARLQTCAPFPSPISGESIAANAAQFDRCFASWKNDVDAIDLPAQAAQDRRDIDDDFLRLLREDAGTALRNGDSARLADDRGHLATDLANIADASPDN